MRYGNGSKIRSTKPRVGASLVMGALVALTLSACDLEVTNPGPFEDEDLNDPEAFQAMVNGMERRMARIVNWGAFKTAHISKEVTGAGIGLTYGYSTTELRGRLLSDFQNSRWAEAQRARFVAESGVERFREVLGDEFNQSEEALWGLIWAGHSNRLLGELFCYTVIDGEEPRPSTHSLERAEAHFDEAVELAQGMGLTEEEHVARAGRASVRMWRGDWSGAVSDAESVPTEFVLDVTMDSERTGWHNLLYYASANDPYRVHSLWGTYYEDYYQETEDPRVSWVASDEVPDMQPGQGGAEDPWYFQQKYEGVSDPINVSSGREMRLIEAEYLLDQHGDWEGAVSIVNDLRADVGVEAREAETLEEGWTVVTRERGIELWGEARRMGDLRRWELEDVPGEREDVSDRDLCYPISLSEVDTNPNVGEEYLHREEDPPAR